PLATRNQIELSETLAFDQVTFSKRSGLAPIIRQLFAECGGQPHSVYAIEEDEAVAGLVANGFGIAVVPNMPLLKTLPVKIIPLSFP
ncbi:LysR substrate-binding domain-containing protein, partial [Streptococcus thermophilus]|nr:LysR family transcriptional regulator [Streptococcus thermophilus]